jgi:hypothetical protein
MIKSPLREARTPSVEVHFQIGRILFGGANNRSDQTNKYQKSKVGLESFCLAADKLWTGLLNAPASGFSTNLM